MSMSTPQPSAELTKKSVRFQKSDRQKLMSGQKRPRRSSSGWHKLLDETENGSYPIIATNKWLELSVNQGVSLSDNVNSSIFVKKNYCPKIDDGVPYQCVKAAVSDLLDNPTVCWFYRSEETICSLLKHLTLDQWLTVLPVEKALSKSLSYHGLVCVSDQSIQDFESKGKYKDTEKYLSHTSLYAKKIANADVTLDLLNIWRSSKQYISENYLAISAQQPDCALETYLSGLFGSQNSLDLTQRLQVSIPIAFAHNNVAREFMPLQKMVETAHHNIGRSLKKAKIEGVDQENCDPDDRQQYVYSFVVAPSNSLHENQPTNSEAIPSASTKMPPSTALLYIDQSGELVKVMQSVDPPTQSIKQFVGFIKGMIKKNQNLQLFAIVGNDLQRLNLELQAQKDKLTKLLPKCSESTSSVAIAQSRLSTDSRYSLTCGELDELSALSDQLDQAEDFELCVQSDRGTNLHVKLDDPSLHADSKHIRQIEKRIRELAKEIALAKEEFGADKPAEANRPEQEDRTNIPDKPEDLYSTRAYQQFATFYRERVLDAVYEVDHKKDLDLQKEKPTRESKRSAPCSTATPVLTNKKKKKKILTGKNAE